MSDTRKKLLIHGRVQGVFYRGWSAETARALGLRGWVRNRRDGSVEMLLAGDETVGEPDDRALPRGTTGGAGRPYRCRANDR